MPLEAIHFLKYEELTDSSNMTQCPQASPFDHTAINGSPLSVAYFFALAKFDCHMPVFTAAL